MIRVALLIVLSILGGFLAAATFAVTVDPDVGFKMLSLPAVAEIAFSFGGVAGLLLSPLLVWALKDSKLWLSVPCIYTVACLAIVALNALSARFAEVIAFSITSVVILLYGLFAKRNAQRLSDESA